RRRQSLPLPPGPRKSPIIGNLLNMPRGFEWFTYMRWGREYKSDIIHLDVLGSSILIVNSSEAAFELMDRRSSIYSSRPSMTMTHELCVWKEDFIFMPYGNLWRECRKLFHQGDLFLRLGNNYSRASKSLIHRILHIMSPTHSGLVAFYSTTMAGTLILSITYGITARPSSDPFIQAAEVALKSVTEAARPGAFLVDQFPWLQYIPAWFPGASFKKKAREWRMYKDRMTNGPFDVVMKEIV
ncbi:cytochrome P450, partial [Dendrothele bispora CBS 962.96]